MVIVVAGLMATATGTPISDCSARFQQSLTEVLQLKKTCATAMYKDCCQVTCTYAHNYITCTSIVIFWHVIHIRTYIIMYVYRLYNYYIRTHATD